jgi:hypothetical protein
LRKFSLGIPQILVIASPATGGNFFSVRPTGIDRFLHGLSPYNAKVAAALKVCEAKLPAKAPAFGVYVTM